MTPPAWNASLVGASRSAERLHTPALVLDLECFEANVARMVTIARSGHCRLRPHVKGPKSTAVAKALVTAGAEGIACATVFEAETMAGAGLDDLLVTTPLVQQSSIERLVGLAGWRKVVLVVDHPTAAEALSRESVAAGLVIPVLVDVDVGQRRTGVGTEADLVALAMRVNDLPGLRFGGIQAYYGHLQGVADHARRDTLAREQLQRLSAMVAELRRAGLPPEIVTGGGTGTATSDASSGIFTELQPGSFPFIDAAYEKEDLAGDGTAGFRPALFVASTVINAAQPDRVTIDAGMKAIPTDGPAPRVVGSALRYEIAGDEFGFLYPADGSETLPRLGDRVLIVPPHCDTALNLHRWLHVVSDETVVDIWEIEARGEW